MKLTWAEFAATLASGVLLGVGCDGFAYLISQVRSPGPAVVIGSADIGTFTNNPGDTKGEVLIVIKPGKVREIAGIDGVSPRSPVRIHGVTR